MIASGGYQQLSALAVNRLAGAGGNWAAVIDPVVGPVTGTLVIIVLASPGT